MVKSDSRSRYLQIVSADHQAAHFQVCPNLGMIPSLKQIKRLDKDRCENLFDAMIAKFSCICDLL